MYTQRDTTSNRTEVTREGNEVETIQAGLLDESPHPAARREGTGIVCLLTYLYNIGRESFQDPARRYLPRGWYEEAETAERKKETGVPAGRYLVKSSYLSTYGIN